MRCSMGILSALILCMMSTQTISSTLSATPAAIKTSLSHDNDNSVFSDVITYLQREQTAVTSIQNQLVQFLHSKRISIGLEPTDPSKEGDKEEDSIINRIAVSSEESPIECRITLGSAPTGSVCIAPCSCTGSQKWVQLSVFNKLRRKEPQQWKTCQTCRQPYVYDLLASNLDLKASALGLLLDRLPVLRLSALTAMVILGYIANFSALLQKFLVSKAFWQLYPHWSKITRLQLALKIWIGRMLLMYLAEKYLWLEKRFFIEPLAQIETQCIERALEDRLQEPSAAITSEEEEEDM